MSRTRALPAALAVCVLLLTGSAGCAPGDGSGPGTVASPSPVGQVLDHTDDDGRHYRQVAKEGAPEVGVEVQPDGSGGWNVRLKLTNFRLSPAGAPQRAVAGRGLARLYVDDLPVADLRTLAYRIPAGYLPHGTHHVTARLYADDATVWAVEGKPVEATADVTASEPSEPSEPTTTSSVSPTGSAALSPAGSPSGSLAGSPAVSAGSPAPRAG
ncbi:hypothetical protein ACWGH3_10470 [Streptomyces sp. NPDC054884]|uniref:hypothetical protein n=1 Tax=Streptomyces sp. ME08-AFT2 TaxID=3028683 RepID=UPI0029A772F1|nr:hypothetical protein [Streptomyces sp. ME08-AFT2]MDX3309509.1 hypothetical protein [Streptomyces sp. ME08-AFT2]